MQVILALNPCGARSFLTKRGKLHQHALHGDVRGGDAPLRRFAACRNNGLEFAPGRLAGFLKADDLAKAAPSGLGHGIAYEALAAARIEVLDRYSTDAKIARYRIRLLADDRHYCPRYTLCFIELPLARPAILAGIKTSAVINAGTATIAAFIGAGGYGERIAAGLALVIQGVFELLERRAVPGR